MTIANNSAPGIMASNKVRLWAQFIPLTLLVIAAYWFAIEDLMQRWAEEQEYSHGFLIPFVSIWMIWSRRKALEAIELRSNWFGIVVLLGSAALAFLGIKTDVAYFSQIGLVASFIGISLIIGGWRLTRLLGVPIAFLFFMIPLPYFLTAQLSARMQLISSELGVAFIRMFQIPVYLDGNVIDLGIYKLGVVEACSGLRYLFPFLCLGFLAAYTVKLSVWKKLIVFLAVIPITIVMNSIRVGFIGVLVHYFGIEQAEGFIHYFEGWVVFIICIALLIAVIYSISWLSGQRQIDLFQFPEFDVGESNLSAVSPVNIKSILSIGFAALLVAVIGAVSLTDQGVSMAPPTSERLIGLPYDIENWKVAETIILEPNVEDTLAADDYVGANMVTPTGDLVNLFIAYIERKRGKQTWHSPQVCIPGGGWKIKSLDRVEIVDSFTGKPHLVNRVLIERNQVQQLVYYWFQQRGRRFASEWNVRYYVMLDSLLKSRSDGALVRLITPLQKGTDISIAEDRLKAFAAELTRHLPKYVPE